MGKQPRWWRYVRRMIRDYPELKSTLDDLHSQSVTADMSGLPKSGCAGRAVEKVALRKLPQDDQRDYEAVEKAIEITRLKNSGSERIELIRRVYWGKKERTLKLVAPTMNISDQTAKRWHGDFVRLVAKCHGFCVNDPPVSK